MEGGWTYEIHETAKRKDKKVDFAYEFRFTWLEGWTVEVGGETGLFRHFCIRGIELEEMQWEVSYERESMLVKYIGKLWIGGYVHDGFRCVIVVENTFGI